MNHFGHTPIFHAATNDKWESVKAIARAKRSISDDFYGAALLLAVRLNKVEEALVLLNAGADTMWCANVDGRTPLHWAAKNGNMQLVEALLKKGAKINKDKSGHSPLWEAICHIGWNSLKTIAHRLGSGKEYYSIALLHIVRTNETENALDLLKKGAQICWCTRDDGNTALHWAILNDNILLAQALIKAGACINTKNNKGRSPIDILFTRRQLEALAVSVPLPIELLLLIQSYDQTNEISINFISEDKIKVKQIVECLKSPLVSPKTQKFKAIIADKYATDSLTIPFIALMLNDFLAKNIDPTEKQFDLPFYIFVKEVARTINLAACVSIGEYLDAIRPVIPTVLINFRALYKTLRKLDPRPYMVYFTDGFLTGKSQLSQYQELKEINVHINRKPICHTARCWKIAMKRESLSHQAAELNQFFITLFNSRYSFFDRSPRPDGRTEHIEAVLADFNTSSCVC